MGIGAGLILAAVGAVLAFAVDVSNTHGFNVHTVGYILIIVGILGVVLDLFLFMPRRRATVVHGGTRTGRRVTRVDEEL